MLNLVYGVLLVAGSPVILYRMFARGKYRHGWSQKLLGQLPERSSEKPCLWFHAVSVGEVLQLRPIVDGFSSQRPGWDILITTTTSTGYAVACETFPQHHLCYFPLDFTWAVEEALRRVRPAGIVLVELELWPNLIRHAHQAGIPLALINGRLGEASFRGYRRIRPLIGPLLKSFGLIAVQNQQYAERFRRLGAPVDRIHVTGSLKFDQIETNRDNDDTRALRQVFNIGSEERVFIAGSTQWPEEQYALQTYLTLKEEFPALRLILVPRHKERFHEVAAMIRRHGLPLLRRSEVHQDKAGETCNTGEKPVVLLDTLGELAACWGLAEIAFVGGSLTNRGGQNMLEPAAYGAAVLFGPNTWNFAEMVAALLQQEAARVVNNPAELTQAVHFSLNYPKVAEEQGRRAQRYVISHGGAIRRLLSLLDQRVTSIAPTESSSDGEAAA